jgi:hypothetical protein
MKKIEFDTSLRILQKDSQNSNWQKAIFGALLLSLLLFLAATAYLLVRPIPAAIKEGVDSEVKSQMVNFNFPTLEKLKSRQVPASIDQAPSGKNPFTPF